MWAVLSNNCWGAELYRELALSYNTPTVGLWFTADDYLTFLQNLRTCLDTPLAFEPNAIDHPIGRLGDVHIQFRHYRSEKEAFNKWTSRSSRLPKNDDDLYVKICDRDGFSEHHLQMFDALPFRNKIAFLKRGRFDVSAYSWAVEIDTDEDTVPDGLQLWKQTSEHPTVHFLRLRKYS